MGKDSAISWCDASWQVIAGCSEESPGCRNCYSARLCATRLKHLPWAQGLATASKVKTATHVAAKFTGNETSRLRVTNDYETRYGWTGKVITRPDQLSHPLRWKKPLAIFVGDRGDLFHPAVPRDFIVRVWAIILICCLREGLPHTFLVCSKRPERMRDVLASMTPEEIASAGAGSVEDGDAWWDILSRHMQKRGPVADTLWLGVTAENQATADKRIPLLLQTPAAHRWVSCEPLLEPVDLRPGNWIPPIGGGPRVNLLRPWEAVGPALDAVIVGGESGPGARPCCDEWIESIVEQCRGAGTPCFVKQCGSNPVHLTRDEHRQPYRDEPVKLKHRSGADPSEWPEELRTRELGWRKEQ